MQEIYYIWVINSNLVLRVYTVNTNLNIYGQNTAFKNFFIILQSSPIKNETFGTKDIGLIVN